jgi:hypothetical protein
MNPGKDFSFFEWFKLISFLKHVWIDSIIISFKLFFNDEWEGHVDRSGPYWLSI